MVMKGVRSLGRLLLSTRLWSLGLLLLSFGIWSAGTEFLRMLLLGVQELPYDRLWFSLSTLLASLPLLLFGRRCVGQAILQSRFLHFLLFELLGFYESFFREVKERDGGGFTAFLVGLILGVLTLFAAPWQLLLWAAVILCAVLSLMMPESGFVLLLGMLPFASQRLLCSALVFVWICFLLKVLRGKRSFRFGLFEGLLTVCSLLLLLGTFFPLSESAVFSNGFARFLAVSAAFLGLELVRSSKMVLRCAGMLASSAAAASLLGIYLYILQGKDQFAAGMGFPFSRALMTSLFASPGEFACFLAMLLPLFPAAASCLTGSGKRLTLALLSAGLSGLCLLLTWNLPGLIAAALGLFIFLVLRKKIGALSILSAGAVTFGGLLLSGMLDRFSLEKKFLSHFSEMLRTAQGYLRTALSGNLLTGVGSGSQAPFGLYEKYGDPTIAGSHVSGSLYLQILLENGIVGLVFFAALLLLLLRYCSYARKVGLRGGDPISHRLLCGGVSVLGAAALAGFFLNPLMTAGCEFCFWCILGITAGLAVSLGEAPAEGFSKEGFDAVYVYRHAPGRLPGRLPGHSPGRSGKTETENKKGAQE